MQPDTRMDARTTRALFDRSAASYDRVNSVISLGMDASWRAWAASRAVREPGARVLDAYAGTGLVALAAARRGSRVTLADASPRMLAEARERLTRARVSAEFALIDLAEDTRALPGEPFDAVTLVFGVRYMRDPADTLRRLRVRLAPDGRLVVVEFVPPPANANVLDRMAAAYFFGVIPPIAGALSGDRALYDYLASSTRAVGSSARIDGWLTEAGLRVTESRRMGFGLVYGVVAVPA